MNNDYYVYILTNFSNSTFYIGVTNNLIRRIYEHKNKFVDGFTKKYKINKLVYFETTTDVNSAILREKQLKGITRQKKIDLITKNNPHFIDLYKEIISWLIIKSATHKILPYAFALLESEDFFKIVQVLPYAFACSEWQIMEIYLYTI